MNSPKSARKNPTMGQIDATVIEAGARQAYQAAAEAAEATGLPLPPMEPKYNINIDARKVEAPPIQQGAVTTKPSGLLSMVKSIPWYGWVAGGMVALFAAAVIGDVNEKPAKAAKNRARDDGDEEDAEPADDDLEALEDDEDFEDEAESEDEDEIDDSEDEEGDDDSDSEDNEDEIEDDDDIDEEDSVEENRASSGRKKGKRERVIEDDQPDQEPVESPLRSGTK